MSDRYLEGRAAWVTGGASGMGRATALRLAQAGADVAIGSPFASPPAGSVPAQHLHTPPDERLAETKAELERHGVRALAMPLDVCSNQSVEEFYQSTVRAFGKIDILVNAAGSSARKLMVDHPDDIWHRMIDTNLNGPYRTIKRCFPGMVERKWGRKVNIASTAANIGHGRPSADCAPSSGTLESTRCG